MNLGILTSGNLGMDTLVKIIPNYNVSFVLTDSRSEGIIKLCVENQIPCFRGNPRNGKGFEFIKYINVDVITSINYLFLIEMDIIQHANKFSFNIHGSLLPKYRGRTPHVWAIINNENKTGITAHIINEGCDTGPILDQVIIPIEDQDTGYDLLNKYKLNYFDLIQNVLKKIKKGNLTPHPQDESKATYFGIRRPTDGKINWNWQKQRIINWVSAQAFPYPGAFSYINDKKITIDKIEQVDLGFRNEIPNGTVIAIDPKLVVKTPNGALRIISVRESIEVQIGDKLS
tara:strand:+ start:593 stop:1453 length:861 start_codon:yes stop_codon:yes gene_type:complete